MRKRSNFLFWRVASGVVLLDQVSKYCAEIYLKYQDLPLNSWLSLDLSHNTGCAWSFFQGQTMPLGLLGLALLFFIYCARNILGIAESPFAFGLLWGGVLGNVIDRLFRGFVVDFIAVDLQIYRWPTFNIADAALCIAVFIYIFFPNRNRHNEKIKK
jgi:signal peptidase II